MDTNTIDPCKLPTNGTLAVALRQVGKHWPLAYSKLLSLDWVWCNHTSYGATDGRTLWLNPEGLKRIDAQPQPVALCAFLLVHESLHALLGHGWRVSKMRDPRTANVAADYIINAMIAQRNKELGQEAFKMIDGILYDESVSGNKSLEQLYRELLPHPEPSNPKQDDTNPESEPDSDQPPQEEGAGDPGEPATDGGGPDDGGTALPPGGLPDFVGTGAPDNLKPEAGEGEPDDSLIAEIEADNDRLLIADHIAQSSGSDDSSSTGERLSKMRSRSPSLDWPDLLREWLRQRSRNGWGAPFNPAIYGGAGLVSAGRRARRAGDIVLVIDTSGSVSAHTYSRFLAEAQAVLDELKPERLHLLSVSHRVCEACELACGDTVPDRLVGGGGTLFQPAFDWVQENEIEVDVLVYLTDGFAGDLRTIQDPGYPILWASTVLSQHDYPFGDVVMVADR